MPCKMYKRQPSYCLASASMALVMTFLLLASVVVSVDPDDEPGAFDNPTAKRMDPDHSPPPAEGYVVIYPDPEDIDVEEETHVEVKPPVDGERFNYAQVLHLSLLFYEAQRSGKLPENKRIPWRGDSAMEDGQDVGVDLTGGWYDAGDLVKFGFPMAWSTTTLNWGIIEFRDAYEAAGELENALDCVKWPLDFFIKAHVDPDTFYCQVGDGEADHKIWGPPEEVKAPRPAKVADGVEPVAEAAAAMASGSMVFKDQAPDYSSELLEHATQLYDLAFKIQKSYTVADPFYKSWSGYQDELAWASMWMYAATNDEKYLNQAVQIYPKCCANTQGSAYSWDNKGAAVQLLLYKYTQDEKYAQGFDAYVQGWLKQDSTPRGLAFYGDWAPNRYAGNSAFLLLLGSMMGIDTEQARAWGKKQVHYVLGDCCGGVDPETHQPYFSYVIGYGENFPRSPHHRGASCLGDTCYCTTKCHPHTLYGAMVGGPGVRDEYGDDCANYRHNEVTTTYNAGFTSAIAALKHLSLVGELDDTADDAAAILPPTRLAEVKDGQQPPPPREHSHHGQQQQQQQQQQQPQQQQQQQQQQEMADGRKKVEEDRKRIEAQRQDEQQKQELKVPVGGHSRWRSRFLRVGS